MLTFVPNAASLGYGLFLAVSAAGIWGGVFPFLPMEFQTREIMFWFFLTHSLAITFTHLGNFVGSYFWPSSTRAFLVKITSIPYFLGWCCLIASIYLHEYALFLIICGGVLLGVGTVGFYTLWQRLFAAKDADSGNRDLLVGTAYGAVMYYGFYLIPEAVTVFLIPLVFLPVFGLAVTLRSRQIDRSQSMFEDVPREHPNVYRRVIVDHWRSALVVGAVGFCAGMMRSVAIANPSMGVLVNILSVAGMLIAAIVLMAVWSFKNIQLNMVGAYRAAFPFLITSFMVLPFTTGIYTRWLAAILYAVYCAAIMLMMMQCAQVSRNRGINPVFIYSFFGVVAYTLQSAGFIAGTFADDALIAGLSPLTLIALVAVYALAIMHFASSDGLSGAARDARRIESIELVAISAPVGELAAGEEEAPAASEAGGGGADGEADGVSAKARRLGVRYRLSAREIEVMELLAKGNSVSKIAETLIVSENTIKTHAKHIYTKLDIHKKQELIDLMDSF